MAVIKPDPVTRQSRCLLVSETQNTSDGYDTTPVTLVFNGSRLLAVAFDWQLPGWRLPQK